MAHLEVNMKHKRIIVIGCSGSWKSTLARKLGDLMDLPATHLDRLYWESDFKPVSRDVFDERLTNILTSTCRTLERLT
jgi:adenylate kinase family enzyme